MVHEDACYAALLERDRRFDGKFFTGVKTTGIYCRPKAAPRSPALGDADAIPATDLVLRHALAEHPEADLNKLKPWRGYAAAYLWHAHATRPAAPEPRALSSSKRTNSRRTP